MVADLFKTGFSGLRSNMRGIEEAASRIARSGQGVSGQPAPVNPAETTSSAGEIQALPASQSGEARSARDITGSIVDLKIYEQAFTASARVVEVADKNVGTLLDITT